MSRKQRRAKTNWRERIGEDFLEFLDNHSREAEARYRNLLQKADMIQFRFREDYMKTAEYLLPEAILNGKLMDFLSSESVSDGSHREELDGAPEDRNSPENVIEIASEAVSAFEDLAISVEKTSSTNERLEEQSVTAPSQQENNSFAEFPSVIHPKVEELRARKFRSARGGEVAFSVDGSPLVVLPDVTNALSPATVAFKQIMKCDEEGFSPASRETVSSFKHFMRKKMSEAQQTPQETE